MPAPTEPPIGLELARTAKTVSRAFDDALAAAGGSVPVWQVLLALRTRPLDNQRALAEAVGIRGATLTHHLNAMENDGLLTRRRHPDNRRVHIVELTDTGKAAFLRLREAAMEFDRRIRAGLDDADITALRASLARLRANATSGPEGRPHG